MIIIMMSGLSGWAFYAAATIDTRSIRLVSRSETITTIWLNRVQNWLK